MAITIPSGETTFTKSRIWSASTGAKSEEAEFATDEFAGAWYRKEPVQVLVLLDSLDPRPFHVVRPIRVHVVNSADGAIASFWEANIHSSGETVSDALDSLKNLVADTYEMLSEHRNVLGPAPSKEFAALQRFVQPS